MNTAVRNLIAFTGSLFPLRVIRGKKTYPPFLPFYHTVNDKKPEYIDQYVVRTEKTFERELDYLLRHYRAVDLKTCIEKPSNRQFHLSFDDGLRECSSVIAPILIRKGIPATFFVCPEFVDNRQLFHRFKESLQKRDIDFSTSTEGDSETLFADYLRKQRPFMSTEEIQNLGARGFLIGAHSLDHPGFAEISEEEQYRQVKESMDWVNRVAAPSFRVFSFPFTDVGVQASLFEKLKKDRITDATFGTAGLKHDAAHRHFQRIPMERKQNWGARKVVHFEYFYYFVRSLAGKNTVTR